MSKTTRRANNRKNFGFLTFRKRNTGGGGRGVADDMSPLMMPIVVTVAEVSETSVLFSVSNAPSVVSFRVRIRVMDITAKKRGKGRGNMGGEEGEGEGEWEKKLSNEWRWYNRDTQELVKTLPTGGKGGGRKRERAKDDGDTTAGGGEGGEEGDLSCFDYPGSRDAVPVGGLVGGVGYEVLIVGKTTKEESIHSPTVFFMTCEEKEKEEGGGGGGGGGEGEEGIGGGGGVPRMERRKSKRNLTKTFSKKELVRMKKDMDVEEGEEGGGEGEGGEAGMGEGGVQKILLTAKEDRERFDFLFYRYIFI